MTGRFRAAILAFAAALIGGAGVLQARLDTQRPVDVLESGQLYVQSGKFLDRVSLSYDALVADVYWLRVIQHYGGTRRSEAKDKRYDLLYPLLDLTTQLDPYFTAVYYLGSVFLSEPMPGGAERPDLAVTLLERALKYQPTAWRLAQQAGFIHYWYRHDYPQAAEWFKRAVAMPGAPQWLNALIATTLAEGGNLEASRQLWREMMEHAESDWVRETAQFRLMQIDAATGVDELERIVTAYALRHGGPPTTWDDVIRSGSLQGIPLDPTGMPFVLEEWGNVNVSPMSRLYPLPKRPGSSGS